MYPVRATLWLHTVKQKREDNTDIPQGLLHGFHETLSTMKRNEWTSVPVLDKFRRKQADDR